MKIFISNLPFTFSEVDLAVLLEYYGKVGSLNLARNPQDGKSRGFAFVEMESPDPEALIKVVNSIRLFGKLIYAAEAVDKSLYRPPVAPFKKKRRRINKMTRL
jgi:RNA recognition motif-containing protein